MAPPPATWVVVFSAGEKTSRMAGTKIAGGIAALAAYLSFARAEASGVSVVARTLDQCNKDPDVFSCLKVKAVKLIDRAMVLDALAVNDYLTIGRDPGSPLTPLGEAGVPRDPQALDDLLADRVSRYLETRVVHFKVPKVEVEGRKKKKGGMGLLVLAGAWGVMLLKLAIAGVALVAGKALLIGKIALLLAGLLGLRGLIGHGGQQHSAQVIYAEPEISHHGGWERAGVVPQSAQELAYKGQRSINSQLL